MKIISNLSASGGDTLTHYSWSRESEGLFTYCFMALSVPDLLMALSTYQMKTSALAVA